MYYFTIVRAGRLIHGFLHGCIFHVHLVSQASSDGAESTKHE